MTPGKITDVKDFIMFFILIVLFFGLFVGLPIFGCMGIFYAINWNFGNPMVTIKDGQKIIYEGRRKCVELHHVGYNKIEVDVYNPYTCIFMKKSVLGNDVTMTSN